MVPFALQVYERNGFKQKQVAGVSSAMFTLIICTANFIGPPLGGILIDRLNGVPQTTTVYAIAVIFISVCAAVPLWKYAKRLDQEMIRACSGPALDPKIEESVKALQAAEDGEKKSM